MRDINPLVSIIINCFNGEKFLTECLQSIKEQTYKNFEVIFWDNKSKDNSSQIYKKINDKRFLYFSNENHTTLYNARNLALKKANGDFICFLDTDDTMKINRLERQLKVFFENEKVGVVYCNQEILNQDTKKRSIFIKGNEKISESEKILKRKSATILNSIIKKSELQKLKYYFNDKYNITGDLDFLFRLSKNSIFKYLDENLVTYRIHQNNYSKFNRGEEIEELNAIMISYSQTNLIDKDELKIFQNTIDQRKVLNLILRRDIKEALKKIMTLQNIQLKIKFIIYLFLPIKMLKKIINF